MSNVELLPKWVMRRYLVLWNNFKDQDFSFDEALDVLSKLPKPDDKKLAALFLSELRKAGWMDAKFNPDDARRRIYQLKPYEKIFEQVISENSQEI